MSSLTFGILAVVSLLLGAGALLSLALVIQRSVGEQRVQRRLAPTVVGTDEFDDGSARPWLAQLARGGKTLEGWVDTERESARLLVQAGWRATHARALWYSFQAVLPALFAVLVVAYWMLGPDKNKALLLFALAFTGLALSVLVPRWILRAVAARRRQRIKSEVPLLIHLLVLLFEAGLSTRQAFACLVREGSGSTPELGGEFELLLRSLEAGADTAEALQNLGEALEVDDLTHVLGVLRQVDRYGGEVREPLLEALALLEERRGLDMREKVNLLSGRMTVVMVLFFFPALLIFVAGPAFVSIIKALGQVAAR
jgi:tight adherence protein C